MYGITNNCTNIETGRSLWIAVRSCGYFRVPTHPAALKAEPSLQQGQRVHQPILLKTRQIKLPLGFDTTAGISV